jgi:squalene synthase HpnC
MAVDQHYENFPVASFLVPDSIRAHVVAIYRFARHADDIADEGDAPPQSRLTALADLHRDIEALFRCEPVQAQTVQALTSLRDARISGVEPQHFLNLLSAFSQDVTVKSYETYADLRDYCRRSANPVGRLMLALAGVTDTQSLAESDCICTALQLINFWQDSTIDASRGRLYVAREDFSHFAVSPLGFPAYPAHRELMQFQCERTRALMLQGAPLLRTLRGRLRIEIAFTIAGGLRILEKIAANDFDVRKRPKLDWYDSPRLTFLALQMLLRPGPHQ